MRSTVSPFGVAAEDEEVEDVLDKAGILPRAKKEQCGDTIAVRALVGSDCVGEV